jgi:hypothetical protein
MYGWTVPPSDARRILCGHTPAQSRDLDGPVRGDGPGTQARKAIHIQSFPELWVSGIPVLRRTSGGTRHRLTPRDWDILVSAAICTPSRRPSLTDWNICAILCSNTEGHATHAQRPGRQTAAPQAGTLLPTARCHIRIWPGLYSAHQGAAIEKPARNESLRCLCRVIEVPVPSPRGANPDIESKKTKKTSTGAYTAPPGRRNSRVSALPAGTLTAQAATLLQNGGARRLSTEMYAQSAAAVACAHSSAML